jgi:hypothetical protein
MPRVVHFEVMAQDPVRAAKFYSQVFGWNINKWDGPMDYWLVGTGSQEEIGIDGGIAQAQGPPHSVNTIDVNSVDAFVEKVLAGGGKVVMPKMAIPGMGYLVYCQDTEGVVFGMMESDPSAQ